MERAAWTDERLDDLADAVRNGFDRTGGEIASVRSETRAEFMEVRREMREGFAEMRSEMAALRLVLLRLGGALVIGLTGIIVTLLLQGPAA